MRNVVILLAVVAVGVAAYFVFWADDGGGRATPERDGGRKGIEPMPDDPDIPDPELPDVMDQIRAGPLRAESQTAMTSFVLAAKRMGPEAIAEIVRRMRLDNDVKTAARWTFKDGKLSEYPTMRAAYISALREIPGPESDQALADLLPDTRSPEETYLVALAMQERGLGGWSEELLRKAQTGDARNQQVRMQMAAFAAQHDPVSTIARVVEDAPRGESTDDGRILANAASALPLDLAMNATERWMDDPDVTYRARQMMFKLLLRRPDPETYESLERMVKSRDLNEEYRIRIAHDAVNNPNFFVDQRAHEQAVAAGDTRKADEIRRRFERRKQAATSLISTSLGADVTTSDDARAKSLNRRLEALKLD